MKKNEATPKEQQETKKQIVENLGGGGVAKQPVGRAGGVSGGLEAVSINGGTVLDRGQRDLRTAAIESGTTPEVNCASRFGLVLLDTCWRRVLDSKTSMSFCVSTRQAHLLLEDDVKLPPEFVAAVIGKTRKLRRVPAKRFEV